jgi:copper(I)-binding protein
MTIRWLVYLVIAGATSAAMAQETHRAALRIVHAWARATVPGQPAAAVYLTIDNQGKTADQLIALSSPVADAAALHTMAMQGDVMQMREAANVSVAPGTSLAMKPGDGYHIMLTGLHQPLTAGQPVPLQLRFRKAGKLRVMVNVEAVGATH